MSSTIVDPHPITSYQFQNVISTRDQLREHMGIANQGAIDKEITFIDPHAKNFIEHSPFMLIATANADGPGRRLAQGRSRRIRQGPE